MTTLRPTIDRAGRFPVTQVSVPFQHSSPANLSAPPSGVLHTTEGGWAGSMAVFKQHYAPHFVVGINAQHGRAEIAQLVPVGLIGLACRAHNAGARVEVEMVGNAQEMLWLPDPETLDALASLMTVCWHEWGIPLSHPWAVGDYGRAGHNPHRTSGKYGTVPGWFGHADMPDPDTHWDPGNLNWDAVFARARALDNPGPAQQVHAGAATASASPASPEAASVVLPPVAWFQTALNHLGIMPTLEVDGVFGPATRRNMQAWQRSRGLAPSAELNVQTAAALEAVLKNVP